MKMISSEAFQINEDKRISLKVSNLSVQTRSQVTEGLNGADRSKKILDNVTFDVKPCSLVALMGSSGSGKTTLLNVLSQRANCNDKNLKFSGSLEFIVGKSEMTDQKIRSAFMPQFDSFLPGLTVYETLWYQAELRMNRSSKTEKLELINSLLEILELEKVKNSIIQGFSSKGTMSGGEQRRVSVAIQLLNMPSIIFLDEPTTGLDASSSLRLTQVLRKLASQFGITIILSLHQPRVEMYPLFDKFCLLAKGGRVFFYGGFEDAALYISSLNAEFPDLPPKTGDSMEYIMALSVKDTTTEMSQLLSEKRIDSLIQYWRERRPYANAGSEPILSHEATKEQFQKNIKLFAQSREEKLSFFKELNVLTRRAFLLSVRDWKSVFALNFACLFFAIVCGWMFYKPAPDLAGIRSLISSLYVSIETLGFAFMFIEAERLWLYEGVFFLHEYEENISSISGFIISRRIAKFFLEDFPMSVFFSVITYFMWGLRLSEDPDSNKTASYFFVYYAICFLILQSANGLILLCFSICPDMSITALASSVLYQLQNSACGYFVNAATMPIYVRWTKYITYFWYAFGALAANQFTDWVGDCPYAKDNELCRQYSGNYQLKLLGFPRGWVAEPIGILIAWVGGLFLLSGIFLRFKNASLMVAKERRTPTENHRIIKNINGHDTFEKSKKDHSPPKAIENIFISLEIQDLCLSVRNKSIIPSRRANIDLLKEISHHFKPKELNVIMGPSGSGKTTLLNYLSCRSAQSNKILTKGEIFLNGYQKVSPRDISYVAGYVTQHDHALISTLTARETLLFQAQLRVPKDSRHRIEHIVDSLIRKMGLVDCANTPVGSDTVKGLSGGEKRRVSIATQLLSRPKILFLDEPTSGLDSATAISIIGCLQELVIEGTTVIMTIHQPSDQLFSTFGSLLLLSRGGLPVYSGQCSSVSSYFAGLGYPLPYNKTIANHILDLVSQNIVETQEEKTERVQFLINCWKNEKIELPTRVPNSPVRFEVRNFKLNENNFFSALICITRRQFINMIRAKDILIAKSMQVTLLAIVHTLYFAPLHNSQEGITNRLGLIQEVLNLYYCGILNNLSSYPLEKNLFYQEYKDGIYGVIVLQMAYFLNEIYLEILSCLFFSVLIVFAVGLPRNAGMFFSMFLTGFVSINCGESVGIIVNSVFDHLGLATNIVIMLIILAIFMGGTMSLQMPEFFKAWNYINPMKYAVGITAKLGFKDQYFSCPDGECSLKTGNDVLAYYDLDNYLPGFFGGLIACLVIYRVIAILACYLRVRFYT